MSYLVKILLVSPDYCCRQLFVTFTPGLQCTVHGEVIVVDSVDTSQALLSAISRISFDDTLLCHYYL